MTHQYTDGSGDLVNGETGHAWPCVGFYTLSSERERNERCTCHRSAPAGPVDPTAGAVVHAPPRDALTLAEKERLFAAGDHHPDHCDCSAYVVENGFAADDCCEALLDTFAAVERLLAVRRTSSTAAEPEVDSETQAPDTLVEVIRHAVPDRRSESEAASDRRHPEVVAAAVRVYLADVLEWYLIARAWLEPTQVVGRCDGRMVQAEWRASAVRKVILDALGSPASVSDCSAPGRNLDS